MASSKALHIIDLIRNDLGNGSLCQIGLRILEYLTSVPVTSLEHISYGSLKKVVGGPFEDIEILQTIQYFCGDRVHLLSSKFEFIENDDISPISDLEVLEARKTGIFIHPKTGEPIDNFEDKVFIYFQPTDLVKSL